MHNESWMFNLYYIHRLVNPLSQSSLAGGALIIPTRALNQDTQNRQLGVHQATCYLARSAGNRFRQKELRESRRPTAAWKNLMTRERPAASRKTANAGPGPVQQDGSPDAALPK
jgi:hypothetical protein